MGTTRRLIAIIFALFFPPVSAFLVKGIGSDFIINCVLTCLMFVPGMIHAFWLVLQDSE